ncbi:hypothetical protein EI427_25045 [Flammeovirga pectinis]|uniref:Uncharacterized protein n=1 Tax=Flammeovirga pectinis TaxID=2494373 RepID=A0A3Q9FTA7_9BACT|nr:hypothetical protein [Flammeovirga pectinis]AZQ65482.1 hypothetical protein EI427_25045 [Flammeovirga pectinis]
MNKILLNFERKTSSIIMIINLLKKSKIFSYKTIHITDMSAVEEIECFDNIEDLLNETIISTYFQIIDISIRFDLGKNSMTIRSNKISQLVFRD